MPETVDEPADRRLPPTQSTTSAHLTPAQLAELAEDLLPAAEAAEARAHLSACTSCQASQTALSAVSPLLASAAQVSIPFDIARRIGDALARAADERLAEQSAEPSADASSATQAAGANVTALGRARDRRSPATRLRRAGAALVGVAAVLGGGFLFTQGLPSMSGGDEPSSTVADAGRGEAAESAPAAGTGEDGDLTALSDASGTAYTGATLVEDVGDLITARTATPPAVLSSSPRYSAPVDGTQEGGFRAATDCVAAVSDEADNSAAPLFVDVGTYEGDAAVIVVLPAARAAGGGADSSVADIWVVDADCLVADEDSRLNVLQRVPRAAVPGLAPAE